MAKLDNARAYIDKFRKHRRQLSEADAVKIHVGDPETYYMVGAFEKRILGKLNLLPGGRTSSIWAAAAGGWHKHWSIAGICGCWE